MIRVRSSVVALAAFAAVLMSGLSLARGADAYAVDPVHSMVVFRIGHFNVGHIYGRFNEPAGRFVLDSENPSNSTFEITIDAAKIDTANQKRDDHLRSPDFFNVNEFPQITFKSTSVAAASTEGDAYEVTGDLTLHGVTKAITITVRKVGQGQDPMGKHRAGLAAEFDIKRSDFGMKFMPENIGDDVRLMVGLEGTKE